MNNELREILLDSASDMVTDMIRSDTPKMPTIDRLEQAIREWAVGRVPEKKGMTIDHVQGTLNYGKHWGHNDCREQTIKNLEGG